MFHLMHIHGWNLRDIEMMIPWELKVYKSILERHMQEKAKGRAV